MTAHATATADTAGLEPATSRCADTVVDVGALPIRAICPVILFWATSWVNHPRGGQTPFADRGGQWFRGRTNLDCQTSTSGASWDGRSDLWPRFLWPASRAGRYRDGQESLAALYVCRHTHSLPAHGVAHRSGFQPRVSPPFRRSCGKRKRANPLSDHAFVRSVVRAWCHSRHLTEKLAPRTKANEYHNTNCKK